MHGMNPPRVCVGLHRWKKAVWITYGVEWKLTWWTQNLGLFRGVLLAAAAFSWNTLRSMHQMLHTFLGTLLPTLLTYDSIPPLTTECCTITCTGISPTSAFLSCTSVPLKIIKKQFYLQIKTILKQVLVLFLPKIPNWDLSNILETFTTNVCKYSTVR